MLTYKELGRMGRFANGMFQIAGTIGIAFKSGQPFSFPLWINHDAKERFGSSEDIEVYKYFVNQLPLLDTNTHFDEYGYFWGYRDIILNHGNWNLGGHLQSEKYFKHCIDLVRHYFTMYDEVDHDAIAVHLRFGDYDGNYHPLPDPRYYRMALDYMPKGMPVNIFSDDMDKAVKLMNSIMNGYKLEWDGVPDNYITAFRDMKRHKHFICGNSSYSLMAAILAPNPDKIIICPKKWFGDHVGLETVDLYPENCIII